MILVTNVAKAGVIKELYIKGSSGHWQPLSRNWGQKWQYHGDYNNIIGHELSFKAIASDGSKAVSKKVVPSDWTFLQTYEGSNF
jgi:hypothetical protein